MIMRALLGLGIVALVLPHEPDLGFGRPANAATIAPAEGWTGRDTRQSEGGCGGREGACGQAMGLLAQLQAVSYRSVDAVRADISEAQRARIQAHHGAHAQPSVERDINP